MGSGEGTLALAFDLNEAFNSVLPQVLVRQQVDLRVPGRILNAMSFFTAKRYLHFSSSLESPPRPCGISVPRGGLLSSLLFNIHLRCINNFLSDEVRISMYADDLLLYTRSGDLELTNIRIAMAMNNILPWLKTLGLSIPPSKPQLCYFLRAWGEHEGVLCPLGSALVVVVNSIKYLEIDLDSRLP